MKKYGKFLILGTIAMYLFAGAYHIATATRSITIAGGGAMVKTVKQATPQSAESVDNSLSADEIDWSGIPFMKKDLPVVEVETETEIFEISAYNTVEWQTDDSPCIAASGKNICGRGDVIACPIRYKFGARMQILDKIYTCEDRMKNDGGIDISFDKDIQGAKNWGRKTLAIKILK